MNRRSLLFGLGLGIIIGAGLLQLMLIGERQADALNDSGGKTYTQAELDKAVSDERERVQAELDKKQGTAAASDTKGQQSADTFDKPVTPVHEESNGAGDQSSKQPADQQADQSAVKPKAEDNAETAADAKVDHAADAKPSRLIVRIPPNASVAETAELLADRGVISDEQAFIDLMRKRTIRAGYFAFQGELTLQQVRVIITSKPLDPAAAKKEMAANKG